MTTENLRYTRRLRNVRPSTFLGAPSIDDLADLDAHVGLLGVPYDFGIYTPGNRQGCSRAPQEVRNQTTYRYYERLSGKPAAGWYDVQDDADYLAGVTMADCGDVNIMPGADVAENFDRITAVAEQIAARDALVAAVGGDHSISFAVGRSMARYESIDIVHFDAHADFAAELNGSKYANANNLRRLSELPFVNNIAIVGLRVASRKDYEDALARDCRIITSRRMNEIGAQAAIDEVVRPARNIYVSIDIDVLDSAIVPGTTLPEPDGISYRLLQQALWAVCTKGRIVGFDICELCGAYDLGGETARVTAWILTHFLSAITAQQSPLTA